MSTLKKNISAKRMALLGKKGEIIFHIDDLANLWGVTNRNTLRVTLSRYVEDGLLYRIYRGFYSTLPPAELDPLLLGAKAIHRFCYVSTETVLWEEGFISQTPYVFTFVSDSSRNFKIGSYRFKSRKLHNRYLFQPIGVEIRNGIRWATPERAIVDMLYFNPLFHFDRPIPWGKIKMIQANIGYPLTLNRYGAT